MRTRLIHSLLSLLLLTTALILAGCPKEQSPSTSAQQEPVVEPSRFHGVTGKFVDGLCSLKAYAYTVDDSGAAVVYEELSFAENGRFSASTSIRLGEEPFICTESGTWTIDDDRADSNESAAITLEMTATNCAGRSAPASFRIRAQLQGDEIQLSDI
jgi:hypothetical protein